MACGNAEMVNALMRVKSNLDSGASQAVQEMAIEAMATPQEWIQTNNSVYEARRDRVVETLRSIGLQVSPPKAGLYVWTRVPDGFSSASFTQLLLDERDIVVTPGGSYGDSGEGYVRLSLTISDDRLEEGLARLENWRVPSP